MSFFDSTSQVIQLLLALSGGLALLTLAFFGYARALFIFLVVLIPFQLIESKYGSINMVVTYAVGVATLLASYSQKAGSRLTSPPPLVVPFIIMLFSFLISWSFAPPLFWSKYLTQLLQFGSAVILFYLSYYFFREEKDLDTFFRALILSNVLVVGYSFLQSFVGYKSLSFLGISELSLIENRQDQRLVGPFQAVGITAEYLVLQSLLLAHYMIKTGKLRRIGFVLLFSNMAVLFGTGNRGGFLIAILAAIFFFYHYKKSIGRKGVIIGIIGLVLMFTSATFLMTKYTDFDVLFQRFVDTEFDGITPDSRKGWGEVVDAILDRPLVGHGPRIVMPFEYSRPPIWPAGHITYYPHSLYLYVLYTTGLVGFLAYGYWAISYWNLLRRTRKKIEIQDDAKRLVAGLPALGLIILFIFLVDQLKVEFLRRGLLDYQHYIAALFGMFAALSGRDFLQSVTVRKIRPRGGLLLK